MIGEESENLRQANAVPVTSLACVESSARPKTFDDYSEKMKLFDSVPAPYFALQPSRIPFGRGRKNRAHVSARYYSECTLHGIPPCEADAGALDAQQRYDKWWKRPRDATSGKKRSHQEEETKSSSAADDGVEASTPLQDSTSPQTTDGTTTVIDVVPPEPDNEGELARSCMLQEIKNVKEAIVSELKANGGDTSNSSRFKECLRILQGFYQEHGDDVRWNTGGSSTTPSKPGNLDGSWLTLSKPTFSDCQGTNTDGEYMYSLGRMSFDMFRPTQLQCSIQGIFNRIEPFEEGSGSNQRRPKTIPLALQRTSSSHPLDIRVYDIVVAFTLERPDSKGKPIKGFLTNCGYCTPDPNTKNRLTVWFSGGILEPQGGTSEEEWKQLFADENLPMRDLGELARVLAAKILLGARLPESVDEEGCMRYSLSRPIGGHGSVYADTLFSDSSLKIVQGHMGSVFVFQRSDIPST